MAAKDVVAAVGTAVAAGVKQVANDLHPTFQAGLNDMHAALKAFPDSMTPNSVLGQVGMPTPGEVDRTLNTAESGYSFEEHMQQQAARSQARAPEAGREKGVEPQ